MTLAATCASQRCETTQHQPMLDFDLISFDLDGTLVDTADELVESTQRTLDHFGLPRQPTHALVALIGHGTRALMSGALARVEREQPVLHVSIDAAMPVFDAHYAAIAGTTARPYDGCLEMLDAFRQAGLRLACVTNKESRHTQRVLEGTGLHTRFDLVVGGDTLPVKKPHPDVLRTVAARLGARLERTAHVGDSGVDVESSRAAGVVAWAVPWGYNGGRPIAEHHPDRVFDSFAQLQLHLLGPASRAASSPDAPT